MSWPGPAGQQGQGPLYRIGAGRCAHRPLPQPGWGDVQHPPFHDQYARAAVRPPGHRGRPSHFKGAAAHCPQKGGPPLFLRPALLLFGCQAQRRGKAVVCRRRQRAEGQHCHGPKARGGRGTGVAHEDRAVYGQAFYNGQKESERPCIRQLLENGLCGQKISLDALHLVPETVGKIAGNGGTYLVGLKENQQELHGDMAELCQRARPVGELVEIEKSHGRIDKRTYKGYDIADEFFDQRWKEAGFQALVQVKRSSLQCRTNTESQEVALYISNAKIKNGQDHELFKAARGHWNVETNNHIRDVTFREDDLRTKEPAISRAMACCRTFALNLLNKLKPKNMKEKLEYFADNFKDLIEWMVKMKVL